MGVAVWTQELMGIAVPKPALPSHHPTPPQDSRELQLLIFLGKIPLSLPASLGPQPQDPKLRTWLLVRAGALKGRKLPPWPLRDLAGREIVGRERSYQEKLRPGKRPFGLGPGGKDSLLPPISITWAYQYRIHTPPGPCHCSGTQPRPPGGHLCSGSERRGGERKEFQNGSADPYKHLLRCGMAPRTGPWADTHPGPCPNSQHVVVNCGSPFPWCKGRLNSACPT